MQAWILWLHAFPGLFHAPFWPTRDHVVPWRMFWLMFPYIGQRVAFEQVQGALAVALGAGLAFGEKGGNAERVIRQLERKALPGGD